MVTYRGEGDPRGRDGAAIGVLVSNLGTPDAPTREALRPYLRQFLSDTRVIELPRWKWLPVLHGVVLNTRPARSAALYRKIWTAEGSPLLVITRRLAAGLATLLEREVGTPVEVAVGMRYGNPAIAAGLRQLQERGCRRILVLPLYPQYFAGTTGTTFDAVAAELTGWRWVPELRTIGGYQAAPGYIAALAASIRDLWERDGEPEKLLFSFHGIPERYSRAGDPYFHHCHETARLVAGELGLPEDRSVVAFQSLFGREEWIKPYTAETIKALAASGLRSLDVVAPGFAADCLETFEELDVENRGYFESGAGGRFRYIPCLNDRPDHLRFLADLVKAHLQGWITPTGE
jgi:ferrochelatase